MHADFLGDSFMLSQKAAESDAKYIVFCGVHFMAESADILTSDQQSVMLPNLRAGCSMADMATLSEVAACLGGIVARIQGFPIQFIAPIQKTQSVKTRLTLSQ